MSSLKNGCTVHVIENCLVFLLYFQPELVNILARLGYRVAKDTPLGRMSKLKCLHNLNATCIKATFVYYTICLAGFVYLSY